MISGSLRCPNDRIRRMLANALCQLPATQPQRSRRPAKQRNIKNALTGHLSTSLCHLGNIATRLGRSLTFDPGQEQILGDVEANALVRREYREHWADKVTTPLLLMHGRRYSSTPAFAAVTNALSVHDDVWYPVQP